MPKSLPAICRFCGKRRRDGWHISRRGKCDVCGMARMVAGLAAAEDVVRAVERFTRATTPPGG